MKNKVYVACPFAEKERAKELQNKLIEKGYKISCDWTVRKESEPLQEIAIDDMRGVLDCDIFIILSTRMTGAGMYTELGIALMIRHYRSGHDYTNPRIILVTQPGMQQNIFYNHPLVEHMTMKDLLQTL